MPYYKELGWKEGDLPKAEKYYSNCISLPMYPTMTNEEIDRVIQTIKTFYKNDFKSEQEAFWAGDFAKIIFKEIKVKGISL